MECKDLLGFLRRGPESSVLGWEGGLFKKRLLKLSIWDSTVEKVEPFKKSHGRKSSTTSAMFKVLQYVFEKIVQGNTRGGPYFTGKTGGVRERK